MKEQLISFETSKLAKDKGFNIETEKSWRTPVVRKFVEGKKVAQYIDRDPAIGDTFENHSYLEVSYKDYYSAPTQSLLQKWLRDEHNIHLNISLDQTSYPKYCYSLYIYNNLEWESCMKEMFSELYRNYEQALEAGLIEALKLI